MVSVWLHGSAHSEFTLSGSLHRAASQQSSIEGLERPTLAQKRWAVAGCWGREVVFRGVARGRLPRP